MSFERNLAVIPGQSGSGSGVLTGMSAGAMATHLRTELVLVALNMALVQRWPELVIHHSDQGCQDTSYAFCKRCQAMGVMPSTGSVGDAYDNAIAESFFATLDAKC